MTGYNDVTYAPGCIAFHHWLRLLLSERVKKIAAHLLFESEEDVRFAFDILESDSSKSMSLL